MCSKLQGQANSISASFTPCRTNNVQPESKNFSLNSRPFQQKACLYVLTTRELRSLVIAEKEGKGSFLFLSCDQEGRL